MRRTKLGSILFSLGFVFLILNVLQYSQFSVMVQGADASQSSSGQSWLSGWNFRKSCVISSATGAGTNYQIPLIVYNNRVNINQWYPMSQPFWPISGNTTLHHGFSIVHKTNIVKCNVFVDGAIRSYLAYDSDDVGNQIRLYYSNSINGTWTAYSGNPILNSASKFRTPSVAYVSGVFQMFLNNIANRDIERWTSTNGINFAYAETILSTTADQWTNPFIWLNPNDNLWYLFWVNGNNTGGTWRIYARNATSLAGFANQKDTLVLSTTSIPHLAFSTIMYRDGVYWLLCESMTDPPIWNLEAFVSNNVTSGYSKCSNSPILTNDEACPEVFIADDGVTCYLFTQQNHINWYQEARVVYPLAGVSTNGNCQSDFADIRFTASDGVTLLNYWRENSFPENNATFWVKVSSDLSSTPQTIYMYYGNNGAPTTSNGTATFNFFDDFSSDLNKWSVNGGTWQIQNGMLNSQTTDFGQRLVANNLNFGNNSVHVKVQWVSGTYFEQVPCVRGQSPNEPSNGYFSVISNWSGENRFKIEKRANSASTTLVSQGTTVPSQNVWYTYVFKLYGNSLTSSFAPLYPTEMSTTDNAFTNGTLSLFSWSGASEQANYQYVFVTKYVNTEPNNLSWGNEETPGDIEIDRTFVSDGRADVSSTQKVGFHAKWATNGSNIAGGSIFINNTKYVTNATGWATFSVTSSAVRSVNWVVTGVNCNGITVYTQTASIPSIVWDRIKIIDGGVTKSQVSLGETTTIWFKAIYEYDNSIFDGTNGILYLNGSAMSWSATNNRWEYAYVVNTIGTTALSVSRAYDRLYNVTSINSAIGPQFISTAFSPFSTISNSTVSELTFSSTTKVLSFTVSGPSGTTGYTNITIAKTLIANAGSLHIYLDGKSISYTITDLGYSWLIYFTYHHSTHRVDIQLISENTDSSNATPSKTLFAFSGIVIATIIIIPLVWKKLHKKIS